MDKREVRCPGCSQFVKVRSSRQGKDGTVFLSLPIHKARR
jgi:DNA-directed RNA polymerase subunit RPC12/RpoP